MLFYTNKPLYPDMTSNTTNSFRKDMTPVIAESRILAINAKHGFISLEHFFVAMLNTDCQARSYLMAFEVEKHIAWLQNLYPNTGTETMHSGLIKGMLMRIRTKG
jgi:hypothetical protein